MSELPSPCGKPCEGCDHHNDCPVTPEIWSDFLSGMPDLKMDSMDAMNRINYPKAKNKRVDITPVEAEDGHIFLTTEEELAIQEGNRRMGKRDYLEELVDGDEFHWNFPIPREELHDLFSEAMDAVLSQTIRERVILKIRYSKSYAKIAERHGVDESAIRKSYNRALKLIGQYIESILEARNET